MGKYISSLMFILYLEMLVCISLSAIVIIKLSQQRTDVLDLESVGCIALLDSVLLYGRV